MTEQQQQPTRGSVDEAAFNEAVATLRPQLRAHCYRMLGSVHDADDALQDTLLRAWRGLAGFEGRSSMRSWLYRIATNVCLTMIQRRPRRVLPLDHGLAHDPRDEFAAPLAERVWIEPYPDAYLTADATDAPESRYELRESVELAFIAALQHLPGNERAALLLRDVLGYSARDVAELMDTTVAAVNSAMQRARRLVTERVPGESQQATVRALGDSRLHAIAQDYTSALENRDLDGLVGLLTDDVTWSMPPTPTWYHGITAVTDFLVTGPLRTDWRHLLTRANGQVAVGCYAWSADEQRHVASVLDVLTLRGHRIACVTSFVDREVFARFELPDVLTA